MQMIKRAIFVAVMMFLALPVAAQTPSTLETVKKRGQVICGVNVGLGGFSLPDSQGKWKGLDVDMCGAVAAAVLGDATQDQVRAALRPAALPRPAVGRDRRAGPQLDHHAGARRLARHPICRRQLL